MEINAANTLNIPLPATPSTPSAPPRNAELTSAVREAEGGEGTKNETRSNDNEQAERRAAQPSGSLGNFVDVKV